MTTFENLVFLVGPGRSGTTLLYKILALHRDMSFVSNYDVRFSNPLLAAIEPLLSRVTRAYRFDSWFQGDGNAYISNRPVLKKLVPSPVEGEEVYAACGVTLDPCTGTFPSAVAANLQCKFQRLIDKKGGQVFITKRTANNRRIPCLYAAFPGAKFIYLMRDGRSVADSLTKVYWWGEHSLWWAGKTPNALYQDGANMLELAARNWVEEVRSIEEGISVVPDDHVHKMRYEDFLDNPADTLTSLLAFLGLQPDAAFLTSVNHLGLSRRPEAWSRNWSEEDYLRVITIQSEALQAQGYSLAR